MFCKSHFYNKNETRVGCLFRDRYSSYMDYKKNNRIADDKTLKLVFGSKYRYMDMFNFIHLRIGEELEVTYENKINIKFDMSEIMQLEGIGARCRKLKEQKLSNRKIAGILNIDRNKVNQIINE